MSKAYDSCYRVGVVFAGEAAPRRAAEIPGVAIVPGGEGATPGKDQEQKVSVATNRSHLRRIHMGAKTKAKAEIFFDVYSSFFDCFCLSFDLLRFSPTFAWYEKAL